MNDPGNKQKGRHENRAALSYFIPLPSVRLPAQKRRNLKLLVPLVVGEQVVGIVAFALRLRHGRQRLGTSPRRRPARFSQRLDPQIGRSFLAAEETPAAA